MTRRKYATDAEAKAARDAQRNAHGRAIRRALAELRFRHQAEYAELYAAAKRGEL